jgi:hypothetical protein
MTLCVMAAIHDSGLAGGEGVRPPAPRSCPAVPPSCDRPCGVLMACLARARVAGSQHHEKRQRRGHRPAQAGAQPWPRPVTCEELRHACSPLVSARCLATSGAVFILYTDSRSPRHPHESRARPAGAAPWPRYDRALLLGVPRRRRRGHLTRPLSPFYG